MLPNLDFQIHSDENDINIKFLKYQKGENIYLLISTNAKKYCVYVTKLLLLLKIKYISVYKSIKAFAVCSLSDVSFFFYYIKDN